MPERGQQPSAAWSTRDLLLIAAIGAVFGVIFRAFGAVHEVYAAALGKVFAEWDYGIWFMPALLAALLLQRPGAALGAEVLAGVLSILLGSPWGVDVIFSAAVQGIACEAVFGAGKWRRYTVPFVMAAGAAAGIAAFAHDYLVYDYGHYVFWIKAGRLILMAVSGAIVGGLGSRGIALALVRTGAVDQTAFGRERLRSEK